MRAAGFITIAVVSTSVAGFHVAPNARCVTRSVAAVTMRMPWEPEEATAETTEDAPVEKKAGMAATPRSASNNCQLRLSSDPTGSSPPLPQQHARAGRELGAHIDIHESCIITHH